MTLPDLKGEIPAGFTWKECPSINTWLPMPDGWFYREDAEGDTRAIYITRERVVPGILFKTGLSLIVMPAANLGIEGSPEEIAQSYMTTQTDMKPASRIVVQEEQPFITYRRFFKRGAGTLSGRRFEAMNLYTEATANIQTGNIYLMWFESPASMWIPDYRIGQIMIENRILDREI